MSRDDKELNSVLFGVLNWGLGHATRSAPIIDTLLKRGCKVTLASDGLALEWLKNRYPHLPHLELPGYNVTYSSNGSLLALKLLCQVPGLLRIIKKENNALLQWEGISEIDLIISDNRYGISHPSVPSVLLTHQLNVTFKLGSKWVNQLIKRMLSPFQQIWIPDVDGELSGKMSEANLEKCYIGFLSTYQNLQTEKDIDILFNISGPEPQRSILEQKLSSFWPKDKKVVLVRGSDQLPPVNFPGEVIDLAMRDQMEELLNRSKMAVSRSGYTSLMDYRKIGIPALLIPTPGQPEQVYLGKHLKDDPQFRVRSQKNLSAKDLEPIYFTSNPKKSPFFSEEALNSLLSELGYITPT